MGQRADDIALLKAVLKLEVDDENDFSAKGKISASEEKAFSDMLTKLEEGRYAQLTQSQRKYAKGVKERATEEPEYLNLASSGNLVRGREVATPEVLKNLPLRPPPRKKIEE